MKLFLCALCAVGLLFYVNPAHAKLTCASIREKTKAKKGKPSCTLADHTVGFSPGSSVSTYQCGKTRYRLEMFANSECLVSTVK